MKPTLLRSILLSHIFLISIGIASSQTVRINEIMASNSKTLSSSNGDFPDWIELYNPSGSSFNLAGWALTDDVNEPQKWIFPSFEFKGQYLLVFASGIDSLVPDGELHSNFKLSSDGEYLALVTPAGKIVSEITPSFPAIKEDQSYGWYQNGWVTFSTPTPGAANSSGDGVELPSPVFSKKHGFYTESFNLSIDSKFQNATVYYTTNGSEPTTSDTKYSAAIQISGTTILRAKSFSGDGSSSKTTTETYLFAEDIIHQNNTPEGYPDHWGKYVDLKGNAIADYEMDPELVSDPVMANRIKEALYSLPVMSLVSDKGNFFSTVEDEKTGGIYVFTAPPGKEIGLGWERPVSVEYFNANDSASFQIDCGIQLHGGHSRRPEKMPKHSFRLCFRSEYGASRLNFPLFNDTHITSFNNLLLRAGFGNTWTHWAEDERERAQYGRDTWSKDTQRDMGHLASHGNFVHLFINGMYWGIYNPNERLDADYSADYMGGQPEDYDIIKDATEVPAGTADVWNKLISLVNKGVKKDADYQFVQGNNPDGNKNWDYESYVDVESLIDYMLINFYGGNTDWDHHNWVVIRNRVNPGKGFQFFAWDQEHVLKSKTENTIGEFNARCPSNIFQRLAVNESFKRAFADRVLLYCTNDGLLMPQLNRERWMERSAVLEKAIDAEAARWGDYRRDVHPYQLGQSFDLYTKDDYWLPARDKLINDYFKDRTDIFISQLQSAGLYPETDAPTFAINGNENFNNEITRGDQLRMIYTKGTVYYTIDGSDPVQWNGSSGTPSDDAEVYSGIIPINQSVKVNARCFYNNTWSAMRTEFFVLKSDYNDIKITEIQYHPLLDEEGSDDYEFVELKNTGTSTLNLKGLKFIEGIDYEFKEDKALPPGGFVVLASNEKKFYNRYQRAAYGAFNGNLSNSGEQLVLVDYAGDTLCMVDYNDKKGWPSTADGDGYSIVPNDVNPVGNQNAPEKWRASFNVGGSPFFDDEKGTTTEDNLVELASHNYEISCFPNPFRDETHIDFNLEFDSRVEIDIFNSMGEKIKTLDQSNQTSGRHLLTWDGTNSAGVQVPAGLYICKLHLETGYNTALHSIRIMKIN